MKAMKERDPRLIRWGLIGAIALVLACVVGFLIWNILTTDVEEVAQNTPVPTAEPTEEEAVEVSEETEATPTPTRVIEETPTPEATDTPTPAPTPTRTPTVAVTVIPPAGQSSAGTADTTTTTTVVSFEPGPNKNVVKNGDFEAGFATNGVGFDWTPFKNDNFIAVYSAEEPGPYVASGDRAQRITTTQVREGSRYAGIYQQIEVIPDETYTFEMQGQIRTGFGDVDQSSFGYRMQYAISQRAIRNWAVVPEEDWVELPWDEQLLHSPDATFVDYSTEIVPTSDEITLFIRTWNKWADPGEAHFTIDSVSLVGPSVVVAQAIAQVVTENTAGQEFTPADGASTDAESNTTVDKGLPTTGDNASAAVSFAGDGRFWGALAVLVLLAIGATFRGRWSH